MRIVGENIPHDSSKGHVGGTSEFISDIPKTQGELMVDFFFSPVAHGKILKIDIEEAKKIPGIVALYTYKDIPGCNKLGAITKDEVLLAEDLVEYIGQPIVIIAAESRKAINKAKKTIKIDIEKIKPVFSIEEAIEKRQFIGNTNIIARGNTEEIFANSKHKLEGILNIGSQEHFYLESQSALVYPGEDGSLKVLSATQNPTYIQTTVAEILGIPFNSVIAETKRMGGSFGGKENQAAYPATMAAIVTFKTKRPARICLSVDDDMKTTGKRHSFLNKYKIAFSDEGKILALTIDLYLNGGYANDVSVSVMQRALLNAEGAYFIPNIRVTGTICKTNYPANTAFRGFGAPQGIINIESIIEDMAVYLKKEALEIRRLNLYGLDNNITPYGQTITKNTLAQIMDKLTETSDYKNRLQKVVEFNKNSKTSIKGISMTSVKYGIAFTSRFLNQASALVNIYTDGSIQVTISGTEMGQGLNTKIRQIVADEFCIDFKSVKIMATSTEKNNNTSPTAASTGTDLNGSAALDACRKIKARLIKFAMENLFNEQESGKPDINEINWTEFGISSTKNPEKVFSFEEIVKKAYFESISLGERGFHAAPNLNFNWDEGKGNPFLYFTNGCVVSEVEIDKFSGSVKVLQTDILMDIGKSINPGIDRGQIIGGFIQGMGWLTTEELKYSQEGDLLTHSPTTYKIPCVQDIPEVLNVDWIDNDKNTINVKQSKAVGEPPFVLGISVWTAIKHALSFIANGDIVSLKTPASNEEILSQISLHSNKICIKSQFER